VQLLLPVKQLIISCQSIFHFLFFSSGKWKSGTSGTIIKGIDIKIDAEPGKEGEILVMGRNVMVGYLGKP